MHIAPLDPTCLTIIFLTPVSYRPRYFSRRRRFDFKELCGHALGAADYIALVSRFHTLALSNVPAFNGSLRSEAYRFVTLVDVCYEHRTRLLASAETPPFALFDKILTQVRLPACVAACVVASFEMMRPLQ